MKKDRPKFTGFPELADITANFTILPNQVFDILPCLKTKGEVMTLLMFCRHTYGFHKEADAISLTQFEKGVVRKGDGKQISQGTGLSRKTIIQGLNGLIRKGYILRHIAIDEHGIRRSYFFLTTDPNRQIVQALEDGSISIKEALDLTTKIRKIPGGKTPPRLGGKASPTHSGKTPPAIAHKGGGETPPTKESRTKKNVQKKAAPSVSAHLPPVCKNQKPDPKREEQRKHSQYADTWENACTIIQKNIQPQSFSAWIEPLFIEHIKDASIVLNAPNKQVADWAMEHYDILLTSVLSEILDKKIQHLKIHFSEQPGT